MMLILFESSVYRYSALSLNTGRCAFAVSNIKSQRLILIFSCHLLSHELL